MNRDTIATIAVIVAVAGLLVWRIEASDASTAAGFAAVNTRIDDVNTRIDDVNTRIDEMNTRIDRLERRMDGFDERLRTVELAFGKIDQRLATIERVVLPGVATPE